MFTDDDHTQLIFGGNEDFLITYAASVTHLLSLKILVVVVGSSHCGVYRAKKVSGVHIVSNVYYYAFHKQLLARVANRMGNNNNYTYEEQQKNWS